MPLELSSLSRRKLRSSEFISSYWWTSISIRVGVDPYVAVVWKISNFEQKTPQVFKKKNFFKNSRRGVIHLMAGVCSE